MLQLKGIVKDYVMGDTCVKALKGIDLEFRKSDFVSILGPSGCGKTTLLNIIGGLDRYTVGDLIINGVSTKEYQDSDWDIYRNNSIGFVFQSYNLISHQTVFSNVELALTLAGKSSADRKRRVVEVLEKVGLGDQIDKKPTQMSGGQMQRVAIARALVNNPDILLADEPTGALDSETSIQIMELLKEIAKDRLVIMVTHNAEIAEKYSTRTIKLLDGKVIDDSNPYSSGQETIKKDKKKRKKISMSFFTALSLSFKNLMTKKARTVLTSFAGSIGIIGIALILSLSSGMQAYVDRLESDTLSSYPIEIKSQSMDISSMMVTMMDNNRRGGLEHELDKIYTNQIMTNMLQSITAKTSKNDLKQFKKYLESDEGRQFVEDTNTLVQYGYDVDLQVYKSDTSDGILQINPSDVFDNVGMRGNNMENRMMESMSGFGGMSALGEAFGNNNASLINNEVWSEMLSGDESKLINEELLHLQYDVVAGRWPEEFNEIVLVVNKNNELSDMTLYSLGLLEREELDKLMEAVENGEEYESKNVNTSFLYEDILSLKYKLLLNTDYYVNEDGKWIDKRDDEKYMKNKLKKALELNVVGILRPSEEAAASTIEGAIGYTSALKDYVIKKSLKTKIAKEQIKNKKVNVFTAMAFDVDKYADNLTIEDVEEIVTGMPEENQEIMMLLVLSMTEEETLKFFSDMIKAQNNASYEENLKTLGIAELDTPSSVRLYPKGFDSKKEIEEFIESYNKMQEDADKEQYVISYTDIVGLMTSSIASIINIVSYVLIAFVAISLVVSSIMIAIITYISVLERTKEIGILRSIGASKKDVTRVFNAETVIEGFVAGGIGILITLLLNIPISAVIKSLTDISNIADLPIYGGIALIVISVVLTVVAGLIPSKMAAKKDPVVALRTE